MKPFYLILIAPILVFAEKIAVFNLDENGRCPGSGGRVSYGFEKCYRFYRDASMSSFDGEPLYIEDDGLVNASYSWGLDRVDQESLPLDKKPLQTRFDGSGVTIYIIDTGVFDSHRDFGTRATQLKNFVEDEENEDLHGHGTHVAGTAGGTKYGVAKKATIKGLKCLGRSGSGSYIGVIQAINFAVKNARKPSVLSLSLGGGKSKAINTAVKDAFDAGHIVTVAAGNSNWDACQYSPASQGGKGNVLSVISSTQEDQRSGFSNYGECTDIIAPGSNIKSAWISSRTAERTLSGTSMACPHVAGVAALLLQKHRFNRNKALAELMTLTVKNKISGIRKGTPNKLLQVPKSDEEITSPPTVYSPPKSLKLCDSHKSNVCFDFEHSTFGKKESLLYDKKEPIYGEVYIEPTDGCEIASNDPGMNGKIVLVKRGNCLFFNKVKRGELNGAILVLIVQVKGQSIFAPGYYGSGSTNIHSAMVPYSILRTKGLTGYMSMGYIEDESTGSPTQRPTHGFVCSN